MLQNIIACGLTEYLHIVFVKHLRTTYLCRYCIFKKYVFQPFNKSKNPKSLRYDSLKGALPKLFYLLIFSVYSTIANGEKSGQFKMFMIKFTQDRPDLSHWRMARHYHPIHARLYLIPPPTSQLCEITKYPWNEDDRQNTVSFLVYWITGG